MELVENDSQSIVFDILQNIISKNRNLTDKQQKRWPRKRKKF